MSVSSPLRQLPSIARHYQGAVRASAGARQKIAAPVHGRVSQPRSSAHQDVHLRGRAGRIFGRSGRAAAGFTYEEP